MAHMVGGGVAGSFLWSHRSVNSLHMGCLGHFPSKLLAFQETESQRDLRCLCLTTYPPICTKVIRFLYKVFMTIKSVIIGNVLTTVPDLQ